MKTGLIAYRQVLRKAGFNYLKCCSSPMAEATSIEFSHIQQYPTFKTETDCTCTKATMTAVKFGGAPGCACVLPLPY